ncbi:stress-associated endoplasmic reticulum 2 isoform 3 [Solea senegalensis]|uniref:Stress-associated endoplasmic reticulum 2 isoform 3 n=1 Tax=Solea senegalensis TaxID=28829 RepID=A0AAV6R8K3_SOLSE|nr:stress-associated endoplasmic reticulum 2 isoform 3 [Solea senegalensis]
MANEKHSKNITQRGNVAKTLVSRSLTARHRRDMRPDSSMPGADGADDDASWRLNHAQCVAHDQDCDRGLFCGSAPKFYSSVVTALRSVT